MVATIYKPTHAVRTRVALSAYEYEFDSGDRVRVTRGKHRGEIGVVLNRMKHHPDYLCVRFEDEDEQDQPHPLLDRELEMFE